MSDTFAVLYVFCLGVSFGVLATIDVQGWSGRDNGSRPEGENAERSGAVEGEARQSGSRSEIAQPISPNLPTGRRER